MLRKQSGSATNRSKLWSWLDVHQGLQEAMKKQRENLKKNRIASELNRMRGPLDLTQEQENEVAKLSERMKSGSGFITFEGDEREDTDALTKGEVDAGIRELPEEDQRAAIEGLRARDRINEIEAMANSEPARLQDMLKLTEDQKDAAFDLLTEFATLAADGGDETVAEPAAEAP